MNPFMKTTNETKRDGGRRSRVESAWKWIGQRAARAERGWLRHIPGVGNSCGHHFRIEDFRSLPRMAAGMDPRSARTRLFKLAHGVFLCPYFQYLLKIQK